MNESGPLAPPQMLALDAAGEELPAAPRVEFQSLPARAIVALSVSHPSRLAEAFFGALARDLVPLVLQPSLPREARERTARVVGAAGAHR